VARQVHERFGGELTIRAQHFSYDSLTSKNLYRVNACIRLPKFAKGSVVRAGTRLMVITNMGKLLRGRDLLTGKAFSAPCRNDYEEYPRTEATVVTNDPTITVLDHDNYQTVPIANERGVDRHTIAAGATVTVTSVDDRLYLVEAP
jgi:NMD protein affecting ribosome stability and mRNA decay